MASVQVQFKCLKYILYILYQTEHKYKTYKKNTGTHSHVQSHATLRLYFYAVSRFVSRKETKVIVNLNPLTIILSKLPLR